MPSFELPKDSAPASPSENEVKVPVVSATPEVAESPKKVAESIQTEAGVAVEEFRNDPDVAAFPAETKPLVAKAEDASTRLQSAIEIAMHGEGAEAGTSAEATYAVRGEKGTDIVPEGDFKETYKPLEDGDRSPSESEKSAEELFDETGIKAEGLKVLESEYTVKNATIGPDRNKNLAEIEAIQGMLAEGNLFEPAKFSYEKDGKLEHVDAGQSVAGYIDNYIDHWKTLLREGQEDKSWSPGEEAMLKEKIAHGETLKASIESRREKGERKENSREVVLQRLDAGVARVEKQYASMTPEEKMGPKGKELAWILESVKSSKESSIGKDKDTITVSLLDSNGKPILNAEGAPLSQEEGIPVEGLIQTLKDQEAAYAKDMAPESKQAADTIDGLKNQINELNKAVQTQVVMDQYGKPFAYDKRKTYDYVEQTVLGNENEIRRLEGVIREANPDLADVRQIIGTLERNSKPYFEKHFGKTSDKLTKTEQDSQHLRTQHEAYLISTDYRATGSQEGDYQKAMDTMSRRWELVLPEKEKAPQPVEPTIPETPKPVEPIKPVVPERPKTPEPIEPVIPERPKNPEREKPDPDLSNATNEYAKMVSGRSKFFIGRTSKEQVAKAREQYETALKTWMDANIVERLKGLDMSKEADMAKALEIRMEAMQKREELAEQIKDYQSDTFSNRFRKTWHKTAKIRLAVGLGITGASAVAAFTGIGTLAAIPGMALGRGLMSGASTTGMVEAAIEKGRARFGMTKKLSKETMQGMDLAELESIYAAHTVESTMKGLKRGQKTTFAGKGKVDSAGNEVVNQTVVDLNEVIEQKQREALQANIQAELRNLGENATPEQIKAMMLDAVMQQEQESHNKLENRTERIRKQNYGKWVTALAVGIGAGLLTYENAKHQAENAGDKPETPPTEPQPTPEAPAPEAPAPEVTAPPVEGAGETFEKAVTVGKGDTVWGIIKEQLHERYQDFDKMNEAQQTHLIDQFRDTVAADPQKFGLENVHLIKPGDVFKVGDLFGSSGEVPAASIEAAKGLSEEAMKSIVENNQRIAEFVRESGQGFWGDMKQIDDWYAAKEAAKVAKEAALSSASENVAATAGVEAAGAHEAVAGVDAAKEAAANAVPNPETAVPPETPAPESGAETLGDQLREQATGEAAKEAGTKLEMTAEQASKFMEQNAKAMERIGEITDKLPQETLTKVTDISVGEYMKGAKGKLDLMEGLNEKMAAKLAKNIKELVKHADKILGHKVDRSMAFADLSKLISRSLAKG